MTINQLANLAKLLEDASKPNSQVREIKQSPKTLKTDPKGVAKSLTVLDAPKQEPVKEEKKPNKYMKRMASQANNSQVTKPSLASGQSVQIPKIAKLVPVAVGSSLIEALAKGAVKNDSSKEEGSKEPWQSKFQPKQY
ncbi:MAG: hypothetical protein ACKN9J_05235 [Holophagaceae bacterium]